MHLYKFLYPQGTQRTLPLIQNTLNGFKHTFQNSTITNKPLNIQNTQVIIWWINTSKPLKYALKHTKHSNQMFLSFNHLQTLQISFPAIKTLQVYVILWKSKHLQTSQDTFEFVKYASQSSRQHSLYEKNKQKQNTKKHLQQPNAPSYASDAPKRQLLKIHSATSKLSNL